MPPKPKGKDGGENAWRIRIEDAVLDEETWTVMVVVMEAASCEQAFIYLNKFEEAAVLEKRFVVKNINRTETLFMVNQLGAEKKVKDDNLRVFEEGQAFLKEKKDIPSDIQALIIKHLILKMKEEYLFIRNQRREVEEGLRHESLTMISPTEVRGAVSKADATGKKGKSATDMANTSGKKYNTVLRERGEEWRDRVYIDDYPKEGPSLYVAITGFMDSDLPACLVKIGIPLRAIVQIRIDMSSSEIATALSRPTKRGQSQTDLLSKSIQFWEELQYNRIKLNCDDFKSTAFIIFTPPYWNDEALSGDPDKIYDDMCYLMYDVQDLARQHTNFINNMDIKYVPVEEPIPNYFAGYKQQMEDLPTECVTIFSLLDSILDIACKPDIENMSKSSASTPQPVIEPVVEKVPRAEALVNNVFNTLCKTEVDKKKFRITYGEEFENHKDPIVIKYGDFVKNTTFHLGNINLHNIVASSLATMPLHRLWYNQEPITGENEAKINFHVNLLVSCFERQDVETDELIRLLHLLACRKIYNNRSSLKKQHLGNTKIADFKKIYLKRSVLAEPLTQCPSLFKTGSNSSPSFPSVTKSDYTVGPEYEERSDDPDETRVKFLFDCPDISELVSAVEIANDRPAEHMIDDFDCFEDFCTTRSYQILHEAYNNFNCVDYKYCEVTDCLIMMFYNSHDKDGVTRDEWRSHIPTPLCLQDFFDFVLEEHYDWIQEQERKYDNAIVTRRHSELQEVNEAFAASSCLEDTDVNLDLIMEGSLKHQDMIAEAASSILIPSSIVTSKKTVTSPTSTEGDKQSSKQKSTETDSKKRNKLSAINVNNLSIDEEVEIKPFLGYDLGDRRVEVFGKDVTFFSKDGTSIYSSYILLIPSNFEYIILNILPGNGNNAIVIHKALGEFVSQEVMNKCDSFRINTKDQVIINIKKESSQIPIVPLSPTLSEVKTKGKLQETSAKSLEDEVIEYETKFYNTFCISWPNGLITESVYNDSSTEISHIKQFYLKPLPHLGEEMRCISLDGEVIIFKTSGDIEVYRPDGTYIIILEYEKIIKVPNSQFVEEVLADKSKKPKAKDKPTKVTKETEAENPVDEKTIEYELIIDEFDIIEPSGIKQKWIGDYAIDLGTMLIRTATDNCIGEVFSRRLDGINVLLNKDGVQIYTFPDKTRIITQFITEEEEIFPEWTDEEREFFEVFEADFLGMETSNTKASISQISESHDSSTSKKFIGEGEEEKEVKSKERNDGYISVRLIYSIEHANFTTVTINKMNGKITIDSPNDTSLTVDPENHYNFVLDSETSAKFDGENLSVSYEACPKCKSFSTCDVKIYNSPLVNEMTTSETEEQAVWLKMKDSFGKTIVVDEEGDIHLKEENLNNVSGLSPAEEPAPPDEYVENQEDGKSDHKSESSMTMHGKCQEISQANNIRFIILNRKLNCTELINRSTLYQYKQSCRWLPWCSINEYDTFGDHRTIQTILTPINVTESEKWVMGSQLSNKPTNLTYKDLKQDTGKGFYHWMRPYKRFEPEPRKPDPVLTHRLPRAYVLRILEQQWPEEDREKYKGGKELLTAILRYRKLLESGSDTVLHLPIIDISDNDERLRHMVVQALSHRIYNSIKKRLEEDVQDHVKIEITTKPQPHRESLDEEAVGEETISPEKLVEEERGHMLNELEDATKMDPILERYWKRRAEELKEEEFYLCLLRAGSVPKYFLNILGGAIWWEVSHTTDRAMKMAERRKMKCICAEEPQQSTSQDVFSLPDYEK